MDIYNTTIKQPYEDFFKALDPFYEKLNQMDNGLFLFPSKIKVLDDISTQYDKSKYDTLKTELKETYTPWQTAFKKFESGGIRKLSTNIQDISKNTECRGRIVENIVSFLEDFSNFITKFISSISNIILQEEKWLDDINRQATKIKPNKNKNIFKRLISKIKNQPSQKVLKFLTEKYLLTILCKEI